MISHEISIKMHCLRYVGGLARGEITNLRVFISQAAIVLLFTSFSAFSLLLSILFPIITQATGVRD